MEGPSPLLVFSLTMVIILLQEQHGHTKTLHGRHSDSALWT